MPLRLGDEDVKVLYLGETRLDRLYLGDDLIWSAVSVPSAPTATVEAHGSAGTAVAVRWTLPANGGAPITGYDVEYRPRTTQSWTDAAHTGTNRVDIISGLSSRAAYEFRVRAVNSEGSGAWSATVVLANAPSAPAAPTVVSRTATVLRMAWEEPANNGSAITGYGVRYRVGAETDWTDLPHTGTGRTATISTS